MAEHTPDADDGGRRRPAPRQIQRSEEIDRRAQRGRAQASPRASRRARARAVRDPRTPPGRPRPLSWPPSLRDGPCASVVIAPRAPPLATIASPLSATLRGLARNAITSATSSAAHQPADRDARGELRLDRFGSPPRAAAIARKLSGLASVIVMPGCTTVTLMPWAELVREVLGHRRHRDVADRAGDRSGLAAARPLTLMMRPQPRSTISGATARTQRR